MSGTTWARAQAEPLSLRRVPLAVGGTREHPEIKMREALVHGCGLALWGRSRGAVPEYAVYHLGTGLKLTYHTVDQDIARAALYLLRRQDWSPNSLDAFGGPNTRDSRQGRAVSKVRKWQSWVEDDRGIA